MIATASVKSPVRVWQYLKDKRWGQPVPLWAAGTITVNRPNVEFVYTNNGGTLELNDGDWLVEFDAETDQCDGTIVVFSDAEFRERFDLTPECA